jgi:hypothetical protein
MKTFLSGLLALSLAGNIFLWFRISAQNDRLKLVQAGASETEELRRQYEELQGQQAKAANAVTSDTRELARLRNEVSQLRKVAAEVTTLRAQAAEAATLRAQLAVMAKSVAQADSHIAEVAKLSPEEMQQLKEDALSIRCVNNLKQIGLAARIWANDHNDVFPPDFLTMKNELNTPKILFCPADETTQRASDWSHLNPSTISYRFLNPNGNELDPAKLLTTCPIHGHIGLSDGSVHRK